MQELPQSVDIESIVDRARALWRDASSRASTARVELFAKAALRHRVARDLDGTSVTVDRSLESGLAVRAFRAGGERAGFAAASGLSDEVLQWAVDTACTFRAQAPAAEPHASDAIAAERWDLDEASCLPSEESLTTALIARPHVEWIEAGTTVEVLIGGEGWLAARRRHRLWALGEGPEARLVAQRGLAGWEQLLDSLGVDDPLRARAASGGLEALVLTPAATSSVVAALVQAFHGAGSAEWVECGAGWDVVDEPARPDGLSGGSFDDAGFPAGVRVLAANGVWVDLLGGPGTFRRGSFREPPSESATNLVMASGAADSFPGRARVAIRCRVLPSSPVLWVMELDLANGGNRSGVERQWVRVRPRALLAACAGRVGRPTVTPGGPIVPALFLEKAFSRERPG